MHWKEHFSAFCATSWRILAMNVILLWPTFVLFFMIHNVFVFIKQKCWETNIPDLSFDANVSSFSLAESPPRDLQIMVCSCAMLFNCFCLQILKSPHAYIKPLFSPFCDHLRENARLLCFPKIFLKKQTRWSNDKTIIELGYPKISWFVSVSPLTNNDILLNLIQ